MNSENEAYCKRNESFRSLRHTSRGSSLKPTVIRCSFAAFNLFSERDLSFTSKSSGVKESGSWTRYVIRCFIVGILWTSGVSPGVWRVRTLIVLNSETSLLRQYITMPPMTNAKRYPLLLRVVQLSTLAPQTSTLLKQRVLLRLSPLMGACSYSHH